MHFIHRNLQLRILLLLSFYSLSIHGQVYKSYGLENIIQTSQHCINQLELRHDMPYMQHANLDLQIKFTHIMFKTIALLNGANKMVIGRNIVILCPSLLNKDYLECLGHYHRFNHMLTEKLIVVPTNNKNGPRLLYSKIV